MIKAKPFDIPKREVWEAFKHVKANQGAAGVDGQSIEDFEARLGDNLYKLWNRLSSGSYMPPPVRRVDIARTSGRDLVPGRDAGRAEEQAHLPLGQKGVSPTGHA